MDTIVIGDGVTVSGFGDVEIAPAAIHVRRGRPGARDDVVDAALEADDLSVSADVVIRPASAGRRSRAGVLANPQVTVAVAPGENAVLLIDRGGSAYSWVYPDNVQTGAMRRERRAATLVFTLDGEVQAPAAGRGRRGIIGGITDYLIEPIRIRIVRFAASKTIEVAVQKIEGELIEGLIDMSGPAEGWVAGPAPAGLGHARSVLLLIHGTFSTTRGSFGPLEGSPEGREFLEHVRRQYDAVIGFDHRTLGATPRDNAVMISNALGMLPAGVVVDTIAYSRGGLVQRSLTALPGTQRFQFGRAVFVGCTNAGTHLANPANWKALVDLYTNLLVASAKVVSLATGGAVGGWATLTIRTIARFVQVLPELAITDNKVPGLAAMQPNSDCVKDLATVAERVPAIDRYIVRSDFEPRIDPQHAITGTLAEFLVDRIADQLFAGDNDLIVDTASMSDFGGAVVAPDAEVMLTLGPADSIYHTIYFAAPAVAVRLTQWLGKVSVVRQPVVERPRPAIPLAAASTLPISTRRTRVVPADFQSTGFGASSRGLGAEVSGGSNSVALAGSKAANTDFQETDASSAIKPDPAKTPAPPTPASCYFAAEMDPAPVLGIPTPLFVSVSRDQIVTAANRGAATTAVPAPTAEAVPIRLQLIAIENCSIIGSEQVDIAVPQKSVTLRFAVQGYISGAARIQIEATQDGRPLASLQIEPVFVGAADARLTVSARGIPDVSQSGNVAVLRIYELRQQDGSLLLRYDASGKGLTLTREVTLPASFRMDAFVGGFLAHLDGAYDKSKPEYDNFLRRIRDFAIDATNQLVPRDIREALWRRRSSINAIHVISDSPYVPWELLYIDDVDEGGDDASGFLCEWGLVRWMYNARWPSEAIQLRSDRVCYVIPDYLNRADRLPQADLESDMLRGYFPKARPVPADSNSVAQFLRNEASDCDLLHFACHGEAKQAAVLNSDLVLAGSWNENGSVAEDLLSSSTVKRHVRFGLEDASGLVFINACQTGRTGEGIAGVTGFADAFLRPISGRGAAGFVGALWSVDDALALTFAKTFYDQLKAGETLVMASRRAREAAKGERDFTWLAYSVYGNPFARIAVNDRVPRSVD